MTDALLEVIAPALAARFRIERQLGRGGMGTVYLATDLAHERPVALKVLDPALGAAIGVDRFVREVQLTARLQHPHICALYDSGEIRVPDGPPHLWYSMPYLPGGSLAGRLRREGRLSIGDAVRIARCRGTRARASPTCATCIHTRRRRAGRRADLRRSWRERQSDRSTDSALSAK